MFVGLGRGELFVLHDTVCGRRMVVLCVALVAGLQQGRSRVVNWSYCVLILAAVIVIVLRFIICEE